MVSRLSTTSGIKPCTADRIAQSPQPGHHRPSWSLTNSFFVRTLPPPFCSAIVISQPLQDLGFDLGRPERVPLDLVVGLRVDEVLRAQDLHELPEVDFGNKHALVRAHNVAGVLREWVQVVQLRVRDLLALRAHLLAPCADRTE